MSQTAATGEDARRSMIKDIRESQEQSRAG